MTRKKTIKKKVEIVFDPQKRKEFLTGFSKRKNERRKRARDELEKNIKEERKRIRQEIKDGMKNLKKTFEPLRELTEEDKLDDAIKKKDASPNYEDDEVQVKIIELGVNDLAKQRNFLGANVDPNSERDSDDEGTSDNDCKTDDINCIPGMDFDVNAKMRDFEENNNGDGDSDEESALKSKRKKANRPGLTADFKSKKDLDRITKKQMRNKLKKSKVFQMKERFEKKANRKKAKRDKNNTLKALPKSIRNQKKFEPSRYRKGRLVNKKQMRGKKRE